ncbi:fimbria/pilus outer membrane usher protein [Escherichia coli]|nr:fimbria/pilus outer membrane usher protein [Hafnia paralvei]NUN43994.1 fimbrial biogenesis outer membrane usher protein [Hafnia paralvei]
MKQWVSIKKCGRKLPVTIIVSVCIYPAYAADTLDNKDPLYQFNDGFIVGSKEKIDLARFSTQAITEGRYSVDVYTNDEWKGRYDLNISHDKKSQLGVCYTANMLMQFGIAVDKFNGELSKQPDFCGRLNEWRKDESVKDTFNQSTLRLDISVPQIYENRMYKGYVAPQFWDEGVPALNLAYMANLYNNHASSAQGQDDSSAYLGINAGFSYDGWLLKHIGNLNWQHRQGSVRWNSNQTYLQRPIPQMKSIFTSGQFFTNGEFFDSVGLRGANLSTDDNMFPDGMRSYAPEIRGVAQSNALVTVKQSGNIIYQTSVPPGPFNLDDVYPSGYGSDLDVTVKEADGSEQIFIVPYSSVAQLLRPGMMRYAFSVGKADADDLRNKPAVLQGTYQYGFNNLFTGYAGITGFDDYQAFLLGSGINTGIGALSFDMTQSRLKFRDEDKSGQSFRVTFNRMFASTQTSIVLAAYRYSTKDYYNLNDALYTIDREKSGSDREVWREKNGFSYTINQDLPDGWGGFYFSGRISDYWNRGGTEKQYQLSYNNMWGRLSYNLGVQRVYSSNTGNNGRDDRVSLNFSYPLYFGENRRANLNSNTVFNNSRFGNSQVGVNGSFGDENNLTYGVTTSVARGGDHNVGLNSSYRAPYSTFSASYSQGEGYRQSGLGSSGSLIAHSGGLTLSPETGTTMALIEAKDAKGAMLPGSPGTRVDSNGYAVLPYLRPYRINSIEIDPKGSSDDISFEKTVSQVVPYEGSLVKVKFNTTVEKNRILQAKQRNGEPLPFGADIVNENGKYIGVVGQGSTLFISDDTGKKAVIKWNDGQCAIDLQPSSNKEGICQ